jgi:hypothetical protein
MPNRLTCPSLKTLIFYLPCSNQAENDGTVLVIALPSAAYRRSAAGVNWFGSEGRRCLLCRPVRAGRNSRLPPGERVRGGGHVVDKRAEASLGPAKVRRFQFLAGRGQRGGVPTAPPRRLQACERGVHDPCKRILQLVRRIRRG